MPFFIFQMKSALETKNSQIVDLEQQLGTVTQHFDNEVGYKDI